MDPAGGLVANLVLNGEAVLKINGRDLEQVLVYPEKKFYPRALIQSLGSHNVLRHCISFYK